MAIGDVWKLNVRSTQFSQVYQNSIYLATETSSLVSQADLQTVADALKEVFRPLQSNTLTYTTWTANEVKSSLVIYDTALCKRSGGLAFDGALTGTISGAGVSAAAPPQASIVTTWLTGLVGRSRRGRIYMPALESASVTNGKVTGSTLTALTTNLNAWKGVYHALGTSAVFTQCVFSDVIAFGCRAGATHPHAPVRYSVPNPANARQDVVTFKVRDIIYTQRRRVIGVGL